MIRWSGWFVAALMVALLISQKSEWQKQEQALRLELQQLQERTEALENNIISLYRELDELSETSVGRNLDDTKEGVSKGFSAAMDKLREGVSSLREKIQRKDGPAETEDEML